MIEVRMRSVLTGNNNIMQINCTWDDLRNWHGNPDGVIQRELYWLSPDEREFLMSGITPKEWNALDLEE